MTIKEKVENNIVIFLLSALVAGFLAGIGAYKGILEIAGMTTVSKQSVSGAYDRTSPWKDVARKEGWIPKEDCPSFPIAVKLASPGNESHVAYTDFGSPALHTDLVVQSSRPIPPPNSVGLVLNEEGNPNFYVIFPYFTVDDSRKIFRDERYVSLPFHPQSKSRLNIWALIVPDKSAMGSVYSSLQQIVDSSSGGVLSEKTAVTLEPK